MVTEGEEVSAERALELLRAGNQRYRCIHSEPRQHKFRAVKEQHPFAVVLSCSDSRVPVEIIFDRDLGDLFVIRNAGNTVNTDQVIASCEYVVQALGTNLVVVMGHTCCGAVTAAATGMSFEGAIPKLIERIRPAIERVKAKNPDARPENFEEWLTSAVEENVWLSIGLLIKGSKVLRRSIKERGVKVVGAIYDINTGEVKFLEGKNDEKDL